jgi:hypothetical protein
MEGINIDINDVGYFKFYIKWEKTVNWGILNGDSTVLQRKVS